MKKSIIAGLVSALFAVAGVSMADAACATPVSNSAAAVAAQVSNTINGTVSAVNGGSSMSHASNAQQVTISVTPNSQTALQQGGLGGNITQGITGTISTSGSAQAYNVSNNGTGVGGAGSGTAQSYGMAAGQLALTNQIAGVPSLGAGTGTLSSVGTTNVTANTNEGGYNAVKTGGTLNIEQNAGASLISTGGVQTATGTIGDVKTGDIYAVTGTGAIDTTALAGTAFDNGHNIGTTDGHSIGNVNGYNGSNVSGSAQFAASVSMASPTIDLSAMNGSFVNGSLAPAGTQVVAPAVENASIGGGL